MLALEGLKKPVCNPSVQRDYESIQIEIITGSYIITKQRK